MELQEWQKRQIFRAIDYHYLSRGEWPAISQMFSEKLREGTCIPLWCSQRNPEESPDDYCARITLEWPLVRAYAEKCLEKLKKIYTDVLP